MLTSRGPDTRVLSKKELRERTHILRMPDAFTDEQIADHDVTGETRGRKYDNQAYKTRSNPMDSQRDFPKLIDVRDSKIKGGPGHGERRKKKC